MNTKRITVIAVAVALATLLAAGNPALAWDVQEKVTNNTGGPTHDLTKIVVGAGVVTNAITNQLGTPSITNHTPVAGGTTTTIIHWPGGTPVPDGGWVWGCFNATGAPVMGSAFWTDATSNIIGLAAIEVTVTEERDEEGSVRVVIEHTWRDWTGTRFPPLPEDGLGDSLGPITGTDVYFAVTTVERPLEELNEDRYDDPDITWERLADFQLNSGGDTASYNLGRPSSRDFVLLRFVASGEGIQTETIHQFQPSPDIPTVSQWGLIVMAALLVSAGAIVIVRRKRRVAA